MKHWTQAMVLLAALAATLLVQAPEAAAQGTTSAPALSGPAKRGTAPGGYEVALAVDHADGVYKANQPIHFTIRVTQNGQPVEKGAVQYFIKFLGTPAPKPMDLALSDKGEATVEVKYDGPKFPILHATYQMGDTKTAPIEIGAAVEPEKVRPARPIPVDFDEFWAAQKKRLTETPMKVKLTPVDPPQGFNVGNLECFEIQIDCPGGKPVSGYFCRPKGAKPKSLKASLITHGAGVGSANLLGACTGGLGLDINTHGIPNGKPADYYNALATGELKDYPTQGLESRDKAYLLGMYLRLMRATEFLTSQPEWDGKTFVARGGSQGGAQSLLAAALDERVNQVSASVPALCDLGGGDAGRQAGWPIRGRKVTEQEEKTLDYFDVAHFALRIKATVLVQVGLVDDICCASSVYAMYNLLPGTKRILPSPGSGHLFSAPGIGEEMKKVWAEMTKPETAGTAK